MIQNEEEDKELDLIRIAKIVGSIIISLWIISLIILGILVDNGNEIGDSFGAVNALFSGLALAGIILTILMQRVELKLQRKELELTRKEMELTRGEFVSQNYTMKLQQFENTFFQMLSMFYENKGKLKYTKMTSTYIGSEIFHVYSNNLNSKIRSTAEDNLNIEYYNRDSSDPTVNKEILDMKIEQILLCIKNVDSWFTESLYSYQLTLVTLIKLIDKTELDDKQFYISVIKSHLGIYELLFIFYKCLLSDSDCEFKDLITKYKVLDKLGTGNLVTNSLKIELKKYQ